MTSINDIWQELDCFNTTDDRKNEIHEMATGVPRRIRDVIRGNFTDTLAVDRTKKWLADRNSNTKIWCLVLSAGKGSGKSVAAGFAMKELNARYVESVNRLGHGDHIPAWWPASKLARLSGYDGKFDKICNHDSLIVIDDLGTEFLDSKGWFLQAIDAFVDSRYSEYRPTIITTNLPAQTFKDRYSERVVDRLREGGSYFEFSGRSLRCKK